MYELVFGNFLLMYWHGNASILIAYSADFWTNFCTNNNLRIHRNNNPKDYFVGPKVKHLCNKKHFFHNSKINQSKRHVSTKNNFIAEAGAYAFLEFQA